MGAPRPGPRRVPRILERFECGEHIRHVLAHVRDVVRSGSVREVRAGEEPHQIAQRNDAALLLFLESLPSAKVFFRPEEEHRASRVGDVEHPSPDRDGDRADQSLWLFGLDLAILHLDPYGFTAIEAYGIDLYCLPGK